MTVANIRAIQARGVMAQVKHYAVYNQETFRNSPSDNAIVDARTENEIYLPAFGAAVNLANVASAMCAYSVINGTYACQNKYLLSLLKNVLSFRGFVTADWHATHSTAASANAGLDLEMPDGAYFGSALKTAVQNGTVPRSRLDDMVHRILREMFAFGFIDNAPTGTTSAVVTSPAHATVARDVAAEGTVLLKNGGLLPLNTTAVHSIAVIGRGGGSAAMTAGGGSAAVKAPYVSTPVNAITARAGVGVNVAYADGSSVPAAVALAASSDVAVVFADKAEGESSDLGNIDLSSDQNNLIAQVAAASPNTVVVLDTGSAVTMPWLNAVAGVLEAWYPGQEDGNAIASVLFGDVNPSGHLPVTLPQSLADVPAHTTAQWPGSNGKVLYSEGLQVGYRWYDAQNITPLFPFGFGLSYTTFDYHDLVVTPGANHTATVSLRVTNSGARSGAAVPQIYVSQPASNGEPPKNLVAFKKVSLDPGQTVTATFALTTAAFRHWDSTAHAWAVTAGTYTVYAGSSSRDLPLHAAVPLNE
jgi:beta-glucosidase